MKRVFILFIFMTIFVSDLRGIILKKTRKSATRIIAEEIARRVDKPESVEIIEDTIEVVEVIETDKEELSIGDVIESPAGTVYEIEKKDPETKGWLIAGIAGLIAILIKGFIYLFKKK